MNPFLSRIAGNDWVLPVSALSLVLGLMMSMAWLKGQYAEERIKRLDPSQQASIRIGSISIVDEFRKVSAEVEKLRREKTRLENAMGDQTNQSKVLNENLQDAKTFAGLTEVEGPGVVVTLKDSPKAKMDGISGGDKIIHDVDVLKVVNELWAAGAEAISVNDHRFVTSSSVRCVGPVIHIDNMPISSPVKIRAIGDSDTLYGGLTLPIGVLAEIRNTGDPAMVQIEKVQKHRLAAFSGPTTRKHLQAVKDQK